MLLTSSKIMDFVCAFVGRPEYSSQRVMFSRRILCHLVHVNPSLKLKCSTQYVEQGSKLSYL